MKPRLGERFVTALQFTTFPAANQREWTVLYSRRAKRQ
jgi:hypothetical protein